MTRFAGLHVLLIFQEKTMISLRLKTLVQAICLSVAATQASAALYTPKAVVRNDQSGDKINAVVQFPDPVSGDLYLATIFNHKFYFFSNNGQHFSTEVLPFLENQDFSADLTVLNMNAKGILSGIYPLYQVTTYPGTDPFDFTNWIGGPSSPSVIDFNIGMPVAINGDFDNDGFPDDDANHYDFHDDDLNKNGYHDDDVDKDGYQDNDLNFNGIPRPAGKQRPGRKSPL